MGGGVTIASREEEADMKWPQAQVDSGALGSHGRLLPGEGHHRAEQMMGRSWRWEGCSRPRAQHRQRLRVTAGPI